MKISFKALLINLLFIQQALYTMELQQIQYSSVGCFEPLILRLAGIENYTPPLSTIVIKAPDESLISYEDVKFVLDALSEFKHSPDILANLSEACQPQSILYEEDPQRTLRGFISTLKASETMSEATIKFILANTIIPGSFWRSAKMRTEDQLYERFSQQGQLFMVKQSLLGEA